MERPFSHPGLGKRLSAASLAGSLWAPDSQAAMRSMLRVAPGSSGSFRCPCRVPGSNSTRTRTPAAASCSPKRSPDDRSGSASELRT